jgi:hypothetical protein
VRQEWQILVRNNEFKNKKIFCIQVIQSVTIRVEIEHVLTGTIGGGILSYVVLGGQIES